MGPAKFASFSPEHQLRVIGKILVSLRKNVNLDSASKLETLLADPGNHDLRERLFPQGFCPTASVIEQALATIDRMLSKSVYDYDLVIEKYDSDPPSCVPLPLTVVLVNLRSAFNVGSVFRTAECLRVTEIVLCGYTPGADHPGLERTAMGTHNLVACRRIETLESAINILKTQGKTVLGVETVTGAESVFDVHLPKPCAMVFGNESLGLTRDDLCLCDRVVRLPVRGWKNSLNVATTVAICGYEALRQWGEPEG